MAKSHKHTKQIVATQDNTYGHQVEQSVVLDDSLLPEASEVEKYHKIDPHILD
jgi:hypothetical protein